MEAPLSAASRTAVLEARLQALQLREQLFGEPGEDLEREIAWLRKVVASQDSELTRLREEVRELRVRSRSTSVERLVAGAGGRRGDPGRPRDRGGARRVACGARRARR
jgi:hypothetical protein